MKITICGSLMFLEEMDRARKELEALGHEVLVPMGINIMKERGITLEELGEMKEKSEHHKLTIEYDAIRGHYKKIVASDAVLVLNCEKKGVPGYIGGNTFLEMGFAHVLEKPIYVLNILPKMSYSDELFAMQPTVLDGDLTQIPLQERLNPMRIDLDVQI